LLQLLQPLQRRALRPPAELLPVELPSPVRSRPAVALRLPLPLPLPLLLPLRQVGPSTDRSNASTGKSRPLTMPQVAGGPVWGPAGCETCGLAFPRARGCCV
jgi:hypothetical protein